MGIDAGTVVVFFGFRHQGAELFSAKGRKMRVLSVFRGFRLNQGAYEGTKGSQGWLKAPWGVGGLVP